MRWVTSSSSDVISFYSLADGVQHVLPFLGVGDTVGKCIPHGSSENAAGSQTSLHRRHHQQQQSESARGGRSEATDSSAALERSRQAGTACARYSATGSTAPLSSSNNSGSKSPYHQASLCSLPTEGELLVGGTSTVFRDSYYGSGVCQQSLGYVTTCVFSGGWGGYDETEVTVGTTEGYVYALPALWPPSTAYDDAHRRGERGAASACRSCCSAAEASIDEGGSTACLHVPVADGTSTADRAVREGETEETYSLPFPTSYVATPVKRFLRLPYTVQHLQMLGAHTPTLAGEYHDELLWLQQQPQRQRRSAARSTIEKNGVNVSEAEERRFMGGGSSHGCGNPSCVACVSCCCSTKPLLSTYSEYPCTSYTLLSPDCYSGSSGTSSSAHSSSVVAPAASATSGQSNGHFASRVQQFFSSDRLLLALDKGGNGVVAHWPAPQYLLDSPLATFTSAGPGRSECTATNSCGFTSSPGTTKAAKEEPISEGGCVSEAASTTALTPLAASFSLNLSVQCCASNPIVTPLLAVVPSVVAAGGLRLLSVFDLVTNSFVFYARPPLTPGPRLPSVGDEQQQRPCPRQRERQHHHRNQRHAHAEEARYQLASGDSLPGRVWSNVCCLGSSPSVGAALRQPGGARLACGSTSCGSASTVRGLPVTLGATAARNMPIRVSSLTWLPALHPLLLGASTNSGLLLLYDLRTSPHPVFCAARSPSARPTGSVAPHAGNKGAPGQITGIPCGFTDAVRKPWKVKQATSAPPVAEKRSAAPEAGSTAGKQPGADGPMSPQKAWPSQALDRDTVAGHTTDNDTRRGRSLAVRNDGKEPEIACERKCGARRVSRSSSRRSGGKRRRILSEDGRCKGKAVDEEPMSISFLATPAWLTSAATSHDAAILPCGCRCCRARAAMVRNVEAPSSVLGPAGASAALHLTSTHQNEEMKGFSAGRSGPAQDLTRARHTSSSQGRLEDEYCHEAAGHVYGEIGIGAKGIKEVSLFGGCAANVVIKPRNSSRPRPQCRKRAGGRRGSFFVARRSGRTAAMTSACCSSTEMPSHLLGCGKEFPDDASHCEGCSLSCKPVSAVACAEIRAVRGDRRRRISTHRKTRDTSWRRRWFAKQEKAILNFFCETYTALLSRGSGTHEAAVAPTMGTAISKPRRAGDSLSCRNSCHGCSTCSSVNCTTDSPLYDSRSALCSDVVGKEVQAKDPPTDVECSLSSSRPQPLLSADKTGARTTSENSGATETAGGVPCAAAARLGDVASHSELRPEMLSSLRLSRSGVSASAHTSGELPFYLLRLASSPCSVLSGFPCLLSSSNRVAFLPSCRPFTQSPSRFPDVSVLYVASCFFSLFARLLYAHRLDQHAAARRLSHHQQRQLLQLLHAVDCTDSATLSRRPSAVDAAISAAAAAESAVAEAHSAAVAARAAGVGVTTTGGAAAAGSDAVQPEALKKAGIFLHSSVESVPAKRKSLQGVMRTEESSNNLIGKCAAFQGILLSASVCSSSGRSHTSVLRSPESFETLCTRETATRLLGFEKKLLSLYADVLLNRSCRAVPRTAYSEKSSMTFPVRDTIEKLLPEFYRRHAQNCVNLLRYAADVLYAFGDGTPVVAQKSAAVEKAVQAATACAASLESEECLFGVSEPAGGFSAGFSADDLMTPLNSRDCAAARGKQEETLKPDGIATEQATNDAQEGQLRCGCGRVEAAVKAKARRWLADEFITEARLAMRTSRSKRSLFSSARKRTECSAVTREEDVPCPGERECGIAEDFVAEAHIVAAAHAVASSICLCELFQSATFFPVLFFNIFRGLCHEATGIPFCIQRNCIRSLPVSDLAYQNLARSQLRQLTRKRCRMRRVSEPLSPGRQTQSLGSDKRDHLCQEGRAGAQAKCSPSSTDCVENVCWRSCVHGTWPDHAPAADDLDRFGRASCDLSRRPRKDQMRTQQLLCVDERGRVYVLSVSLRIASGRRSKHGSAVINRVDPAGGDAPSLAEAGRLVNGRMASHRGHKQHEARVADAPSPQQTEICVEHHSARPKWNKGVQELVPADLRGVIHMQLLNTAVCPSRKKPTCAVDAADGHVVTDEQEPGERRCLPSYFERACWPECSTMRKNLLWGSEGTEEVLQLEKSEQDFFCRSEHEDGSSEHNNVHKKMWNQRWLCRRRRIEWCGACRPVANGASCTIPGTSENVRLVDAGKSVNSAESKNTSCTSSMWGSYAVTCQEQMSGGGDDIVSAEATGDSTISQAAEKLGRSRTSSATRGFRAIKKKGKRSARFIKENDESTIAQRVTSTAAAARLAQINANRSLLRLFPLLPVWNSCSRPQCVSRWRRKLHGRCCSQNRIPSRTPCTKTHSHVNSRCPQRKDAAQTEERCKLRSEFPARALGIGSMLKEVSNVACPARGGASIAQIRHTDAPRAKEECREGALYVASGKKIDTSTHTQSKEEKRIEFCRRICCRLQVEEEASFDINGKTNHGHLGSDSCRSRVVSLAIHENGRYVLAATCAPSFLLYASSPMGPLPPYEHKDRLLFGCATGTVPPSRPFRLISISRGASFSGAASVCPSHRGVPTVSLPGAPSGPRPPPPVLISASPILPPGAAAPFVPYTLLRRQVDHGVASGLSCDGSVSTRRLVRCRPGLPVSLGRQSAQMECGGCGRRSGDPGQAAFSDWLTDEEDEKELHGGATGSETGSASDA